ncbi:MAG: helix-turn-helix domain-containing protein [Salinivirgaceae bacterium]|nr:helix-turn-helix domain-containing protein [Salinivirgaceae bacterium]
MRNIDLIFNISRNSFYTDDTGSPQKLPNLYFYGLSSKQNFKLVKPSGNLFTIGVSFKPTGLFPILGIPIVEFKNKIINLSDLVPKLSHQWFEQILNANTLHDKLKSIEAGLLNLLDSNQNNEGFSKVFDAFKMQSTSTNLDQFCKNINISKRTLERNFNVQVGMNPKTYLRLNRFQNTLNQALYTKYDRLGDLAFDNHYFDQMHFIRDFKSFAGETPSQFLNNKSSLKAISFFQ